MHARKHSLTSWNSPGKPTRLKYIAPHPNHNCRRVIQLTDLSRKMENLVEQILPFQPTDQDHAAATTQQPATHSSSVAAGSGISVDSSASASHALAEDHPSSAGTNTDDASAAFSSPNATNKPKAITKHAVIVAPPSHQSSVWSPDGRQPIHPPDRWYLCTCWLIVSKLLCCL